MYSGLNTNCCSGRNPLFLATLTLEEIRLSRWSEVCLSVCLDHGALWCIKGTGESMTRVYGFIGSFYAPWWSRQILDHWSWSKSPPRNGVMDIRSRWINLQYKGARWHRKYHQAARLYLHFAFFIMNFFTYKYTAALLPHATMKYFSWFHTQKPSICPSPAKPLFSCGSFPWRMNCLFPQLGKTVHFQCSSNDSLNVN